MVRKDTNGIHRIRQHPEFEIIGTTTLEICFGLGGSIYLGESLGSTGVTIQGDKGK